MAAEKRDLAPNVSVHVVRLDGKRFDVLNGSTLIDFRGLSEPSLADAFAKNFLDDFIHREGKIQLPRVQETLNEVEKRRLFYDTYRSSDSFRHFMRFAAVEAWKDDNDNRFSGRFAGFLFADFVKAFPQLLDLGPNQLIMSGSDVFKLREVIMQARDSEGGSGYEDIIERTFDRSPKGNYIPDYLVVDAQTASITQVGEITLSANHNKYFNQRHGFRRLVAHAPKTFAGAHYAYQ